jgi:hypothetical protein
MATRQQSGRRRGFEYAAPTIEEIKQMPDTAYINRRSTASKRDWGAGHCTPEQIARECLAEACNNPDRAIALAGKRARGAKLRATVVAIGSALLRASPPAKGGAS